MSIDPLCDLMRLLEDPSRREILLRLAGHPMVASAVAYSIGTDVLSTDGHLQELSTNGLIEELAGPGSKTYRLHDRVAVAFVSGLAEVRVSAPGGSALSFVTAAPVDAVEVPQRKCNIPRSGAAGNGNT